jgi:uncharacterized protein
MSESRSRSGVWRVLRIGLLVYLGLLLLLAGCQRRYIYYPQREAAEVLLRQGAQMGFEPWLDGEGKQVGWRGAAPEMPGAVRRVVVFHGNAGMALHRGYYVDAFQALPGRWEVLIFEYPGYGSRPGRPSEAAFYDAARAALATLEPVEGGTLFLVGESLGTGVATRMAGDSPGEIDGLILITPFTDLAAVGARHFRGLPVRLLLRDRYNNTGALADYGGPVAVILAERDEVIPADIGQQLHDDYDGPKALWIQEGRTHNTLDLDPGAAWWEEVVRFLDEQARRGQ